MRTRTTVLLAIAGLVLAQTAYTVARKKAATRLKTVIPAPESEDADPAIAATVSPPNPSVSESAEPVEPIGNAAPPDSGSPAPGSEAGSPPGDIAETATAPLPPPDLAAETVSAIIVSDPDNAVRTVLRRDPVGWRLASLGNAGADGRKVAAFLDKLLLGDRLPAKTTAAESGLDAGFAITLLDSSGNVRHRLRIGLRPAGVYDAVFARELGPGGEGPIFRLAADIRGELDLWRNLPDEMPDSRSWLPSRPLAFDPAEATGISAIFSGIGITLEKNAGGGWRHDGEEGDDRDREALAAWLADLSRLRTAGALADEGTPEGTEAFLVLRLAGDKQTRLEFFPALSGPNPLLRSSAFPGILYVFPSWRLDRALGILERILDHWSGATGDSPWRRRPGSEKGEAALQQPVQIDSQGRQIQSAGQASENVGL